MTFRPVPRGLAPLLLAIVAAAGCANGSTSAFVQAPLIVSASAQEANEILGSTPTDTASSTPVAAYVAVGNAPESPVYIADALPDGASQTASAAATNAATAVLGDALPASVAASSGLGRPVGLAVATPFVATSVSANPPASAALAVATPPAAASVQTGLATPTTATIATPVATTTVSTGLTTPTSATVASSPAAATVTASLTNPTSVSAAAGPVGGTATVGTGGAATGVKVGGETATASVPLSTPATGVLGSARAALASAAPTAVSPLLANALSAPQHSCLLKLKC